MLDAGGTLAGAVDRQACERERMLGGILAAGAGILALLILVSPFFHDPVNSLITYGPGVALHLGHLLWLRWPSRGSFLPRPGRARRVAISHCLTYLLYVTAILAFQLGGLRAPAALVYPPLVLLAGLVWSGAAALGMALASTLAAIALVWLESNGVLTHHGLPVTPLRLLMVLIACVIITAVMIRHALDIIERTTQEALENEQRHAEQRQRLELELREAQRIEALGRLAGGVAHDFNNLLTVIMGYAALLPRESSDEREAVEAIELASQRARALTHQLLAFGRRQVLRPEVLELSAAIRELEPLFGRLIHPQIRVDLELADAPCFTRVDRSQLGQVVINLVANARDSMPRGGQLTIATGRDQPRDWNGGVALPEHGVWLSVRDTGFGIDPAVRTRIFEPFFTTKTAGNGTGLGLATVHGIVTQSGGTVAVESEPGRGTRFLVALPSAEAPEEAAARAPREASLPAPAGQQVLVVDDDAPLREVMRGVLDRAGYRVRVADSGARALEQLQGDASPIDLLVSDVVMFGMNGVELARCARAQLPHLPVLFVSGHAPELADSAKLELGTEFLAKPFGPEELLQKVRQTLASAKRRWN
jgi:signal transduction histidine kinase/ActR/RegA family two-component response regulator